MKIEPGEVDFGTKGQNLRLEAVVKLTNASDKDVQIFSVASDCSCTAGEPAQKTLAPGASTTMRSRHLSGHAVDLGAIVDGQVRWDWPLYHQLAVTVKLAAMQLGVPLEWGGDWESFKDGPHWQLPWAEYP